MSRRFMLLNLLLFAFVLMLTSCSRGSGNSNLQGPAIATETLRIAWINSSKWGDDKIADRLEKQFGVELDFINLNWSDAINKINVMIASGDVPDLFYYTAMEEPSTKPVYIKWAEHGILKPLPDDLSKYPNIANLMRQYEFMKVKGKFYSIPRIAWSPGNAHMSAGILFRTDYLRNVGITRLPETTDQFVEMLIALRDGDPDGNGKHDTIPLDIGNVGALFLQSLFNMTNGWILEDGKYVPAQLSSYFLAYTKFMKMLYDEKLLNQNFAVMTQDQMVDNFVQGKSASIGAQFEAGVLHMTYYDKMIQMNPDFLNVVDMLPLTRSAHGEILMINQFNHYSVTMFNGKMDDAKFDRALQLYDYLLSEEGIALMRWGIEGEDFKWMDGKRVSLLPVDEATELPQSLVSAKPTAAIKQLVSWDVDGWWDNPAIPQALVDLEKKHIALYQPYIQQDAGATINYLVDPALDKFIYTDRMTAFFNDAIFGKYDDIDTAFQQVVQQLLTERGGYEAIRVANQRVAGR